MSSTSGFNKEEKTWQKFHDKNETKSDINKEYSEWRKTWRENGPIRFAHEVLQIDPKNGGPLMLSQDQKDWLTDVCFNNVQLSIISAGRGSGKTFVLACYITWRIFCFEFYNISCMGGSGEQSDIIDRYIKGWIRHSPELRKYTAHNIKKSITTHANSGATFRSCSATSVRGPHVRDIIIDEEGAGEEEGGTDNIRAALWEVSTAKDLRIIKSSTPQLLWGDFLETWNEHEKLGFKRYRWAISKHTSGELDPYKIFKDEVLHHWLSNVPWVEDSTIQIQRRQKSNEEWLVEALGAFSITSGLVFNPLDVDSCVCDKCHLCLPYQEPDPEKHFDGCPLIQYTLNMNGMNSNDVPRTVRGALQYVGDRVIGIDWGQVAEDAYSVVGRYEGSVFVLDYKELLGQNTDEKLSTADRLCKKWFIDIIRPDPAQWPYNEALESMGYTIHKLFSFEGGADKEDYTYDLKKLVESHRIIIPKAFKGLIKCLKNLSYDTNGKIRKHNDHPFDSLIYAVSLYGEEDESPVLSQNDMAQGTGAKIWQEPNQNKNVLPEPKDKDKEEEDTKEKPFNPFDEEYLRRRKAERRGEGEGAVLW